jgi:cytochrome c oxidase subunit 2
MFSEFPLFPEQASSVASRVDAFYFFLIAVTVFFSVLIFTVLATFAVRYRRRSREERPDPIHGSLALELTWTLIPAVLVAVMFFWSADIFFVLRRPPRDAMEIKVVGKRWMWKLQHLNGQREINELHVPVGVPVKLTMTSEDVIHGFFIPAFRVKMDVIPGRYTSLWFKATKPGRYHLFCAEYCGTKHSGMTGWVVVMEPAEFQAWLSGAAGVSLAAAGQKLFQDLGCVTCHQADSTGRGPTIQGLMGRPVRLTGGESVVADEAYIRESIVTPTAKIVDGYQPIMPTYQGLVSEEGLMQLIAYVESLKPREGAQETVAPEQDKGGAAPPQAGKQ